MIATNFSGISVFFFYSYINASLIQLTYKELKPPLFLSEVLRLLSGPNLFFIYGTRKKADNRLNGWNRT